MVPPHHTPIQCIRTVSIHGSSISVTVTGVSLLPVCVFGAGSTGQRYRGVEVAAIIGIIRMQRTKGKDKISPQ